MLMAEIFAQFYFFRSDSKHSGVEELLSSALFVKRLFPELCVDGVVVAASTLSMLYSLTQNWQVK